MKIKSRGGQLYIEIPVVLNIPIVYEVIRRELPYGLHLTGMEDQCMYLLAENLSNKQIGARLNIGERTVKFHVSNLLKKFKCTSRSILMDIARTNGRPTAVPVVTGVSK